MYIMEQSYSLMKVDISIDSLYDSISINKNYMINWLSDFLDIYF